MYHKVIRASEHLHTELVDYLITCFFYEFKGCHTIKSTKKKGVEQIENKQAGSNQDKLIDQDRISFVKMLLARNVGFATNQQIVRKYFLNDTDRVLSDRQHVKATMEYK